MDSVTADITDLDSADLQNNEALLIHSDYNLYDMAKDAETIPYEIITRLGTRAYRNFALI